MLPEGASCGPPQTRIQPQGSEYARSLGTGRQGHTLGSVVAVTLYAEAMRALAFEVTSRDH